jgi:hypothetical protein
VATSELPFFQSPPPTLRHLPLTSSAIRLDAAPGSGVVPQRRKVDRLEHGRALMRQIENIEGQLTLLSGERQREGLPGEVDLVLEIDSEPGFPLSAEEIHQLTTSSSIQLLHAIPQKAADGRDFTRILIHVPFGNLAFLAEKFRRFAEDTTPTSNTPNPWVANVHRVARAALTSMWTDPTPIPEGDNSIWWQLWVRRSGANREAFRFFAERAGLQIKPGEVKLPQHIVVVASATRNQLESSIDLLNTLAEVRLAKPCHYELTQLSSEEQMEWIADAADRIIPPAENAPYVCLLDGGVNRGHPLLQRVFSEPDNHTIFGDGDSSDSYENDGHGTPMAGLAAFGDLRELIASTGSWNQRHRLEAVKVIDPNRSHEPENYGAVTEQAVLTPEVAAKDRLRVFSMPITSEGESDGRPSAWSAAVDMLAYGGEEPGGPKRLLILSAGNARSFDADFSYPASNFESPVEDPSQAWNAISVGAISHFQNVQENDPESSRLKPLAPGGGLSPHSRTSVAWNTHWPIKPEIVMEGGNLGLHPDFGVERRDSLEPLTTSKRISQRPIAPIRATSAATALSAKLAAEIWAEYPELWPETVRGLLVHSARWNDTMLEGLDPHRPGTSQSVQLLLRKYGYGEPVANRARASSQNEVTLLRQDALFPYKGSSGSASINDCHVHRIPLPADLLQSVGSASCVMRVTLSYFTAPNPSASNRIPGSRYRYGGSLLRFRVRHKDESDTEFMALVSRDAEEEGGDNGAESVQDRAWALGHKLRNKGGSVVHDVWQGSAADIVTMDHIAIFPVKGWWAFRSFPSDSPWHRCFKNSMRYSLIVSVEVMADIPLYSEIRNVLSIPIEASV